ncbi:hypothetical protein VEE53_27150 [Escherichia coli]|nr:hypothetical protein VEE53_27150 [Escherichia coli]
MNMHVTMNCGVPYPCGGPVNQTNDQRMTGSNARWKWTTDYNRRSIAETAMYRVKQLFGGTDAA